MLFIYCMFKLHEAFILFRESNRELRVDTAPLLEVWEYTNVTYLGKTHSKM